MDSKKRVMKGSAHASPEIRRAELLQAAIICFGRNGYFKTTIDHIAKQANLSKGSVYRFFKSKDDVLCAIMDYYEQEVDKLITKELAHISSPREALRLTLRTIICYLSQHSEMERTWREFTYHPLAIKEYSRMLNDFNRELRTMLEQGVANGIFIEQDLDPVVDILISFHEGLFELSSSIPDFCMLERFDACWGVLERLFVSPQQL